MNPIKVKHSHRAVYPHNLGTLKLFGVIVKTEGSTTHDTTPSQPHSVRWFTQLQQSFVLERGGIRAGKSESTCRRRTPSEQRHDCCGTIAIAQARSLGRSDPVNVHKAFVQGRTTGDFERTRRSTSAKCARGRESGSCLCSLGVMRARGENILRKFY